MDVFAYLLESARANPSDFAVQQSLRAYIDADIRKREREAEAQQVAMIVSTVAPAVRALAESGALTALFKSDFLNKTSLLEVFESVMMHANEPGVHRKLSARPVMDETCPQQLAASTPPRQKEEAGASETGNAAPPIIAPVLAARDDAKAPGLAPTGFPSAPAGCSIVVPTACSHSERILAFATPSMLIVRVLRQPRPRGGGGDWYDVSATFALPSIVERVRVDVVHELWPLAAYDVQQQMFLNGDKEASETTVVFYSNGGAVLRARITPLATGASRACTNWALSNDTARPTHFMVHFASDE